MRWLMFRKWVLVAHPARPEDPTCVEAAALWNRSYTDAKMNRFFLRNAAEMEMAQQQMFWQPWIRFAVEWRTA